MTLPAQVIDLANWKLTLPVKDATKDSPQEITQPDLATETNTWFKAVGEGVAFRAPVNGYTTSGSSYPRSELREMNADGSLASWGSNDGKVHILTVEEAFTHLPLVKPHLVGAQIHDAADDICVFRLEGTSLYVTNGDDTHAFLADANYALGTRYEAKFVVSGGQVQAFYNGKLVATIVQDFSGAYFKAGAYTQANATNSSPADESNYGETIVYKLSVSHTAVVVTDPPPVDPPPAAAPVIIQIIRHGEKPAGSVKGYTDPSGKTEDSHSLTLQGWQRAQGLVGLFNPAGPLKAGLTKPTKVYAADGSEAGERMKETVSFLSPSLGLSTVLSFDKGKEKDLAKALKALKAGDVALVCWEHSTIIDICKALGVKVPDWPDARFDIVFVLKSDGKGSYSFTQIPELVLPTDSTAVIK